MGRIIRIQPVVQRQPDPELLESLKAKDRKRAALAIQRWEYQRQQKAKEARKKLKQ